MKKAIQKMVSTILALTILFTLCTPAFAAVKPDKSRPEKMITSAQDVAIGATGTIVTAGNYIYSIWFGNGNESWTTSVQDWASFVSDVSNVVRHTVPDATARSIATALYLGAQTIIHTGFEIDHSYGTIEKEYREVKYSDGSFAFFQSKYKVNAVAVSASGTEKKLPVVTEYYEGAFPMFLDE